MPVTRAKFKALANKFVNNTFADFVKTYTFEALTRIPDGQGGFTEDWNAFATITGFVKDVKNEKGELDQHIKSDVEKMFEFEYIAGINAKMRILYDGEYYNIDPEEKIYESDVWIKVKARKARAT
jgi:SPP1 family predicted phage head-tail adaptor